MTVRQLKLLVTVCDQRNLTRAAGLLYMTQSAVSQNLRKMEDELGIPLFIRNGRQIIPSPVGESFCLHARNILKEYEKALAELASEKDEILFHYYSMLPFSVKDKILSDLWEIDPYLQIRQIDQRVPELLDNSRWESGALYLVPGEFLSDPNIQTIRVATAGHVVVMRKTHHLHDRSLVYPEDLEGETIWLRSERERHFPPLVAALEQLDKKDISYQTVVAEQAQELIPRIITFGGVAIVPEFLVREEPEIVIIPFVDSIQTDILLAYKGPLSSRTRKMLAAYQKRICTVCGK